MWIWARVSGYLIGSGIPERRIVIVTLLPAAPRRAFTASSFFHPSVDFPSTSMIRSPVWMPARSAGVSGSGATTVIHPSRTSI